MNATFKSNVERDKARLATDNPPLGARFSLADRDAMAQKLVVDKFDPKEPYDADAVVINAIDIANIFAYWANRV